MTATIRVIEYCDDNAGQPFVFTDGGQKKILDPDELLERAGGFNYFCRMAFIPSISLEGDSLLDRSIDKLMTPKTTGADVQAFSDMLLRALDHKDYLECGTENVAFSDTPFLWVDNKSMPSPSTKLSMSDKVVTWLSLKPITGVCVLVFLIAVSVGLFRLVSQGLLASLSMLFGTVLFLLLGLLSYKIEERKRGNIEKI